MNLVDIRTFQDERVENMVIKRNGGRYAVIEDVLFLLRMKYNLLSVGKLIKKGFFVIMKSLSYIIY